jgi:aryl-alcohol dehydrogenase-like predicted oxidoreductase
MNFRTIGSLEVSVVGLGTNNFGFTMDAAEVPGVVNAALDAGINFFDTADSYLASEERLGAALGARRDEVIIATKFASPLGADTPGGASAAYVRQAVERSLSQLGTDRIDLYQIHRPDPATPIAETLGALNELVVAGKVREIGCSNFTAPMLREAQAAVADGAAGFASVQNHYNMLQRDDEAEVIPTCGELGLAYLPYFPLASGLLTGKYHRNEAPAPGTRLDKWGERAQGALTDANFDVIEALTAFARDHGHDLVDLAFAWLLAQPTVASVIAGATRPVQVHANAAAGTWTLSNDELTQVNALLA